MGIHTACVPPLSQACCYRSTYGMGRKSGARNGLSDSHRAGSPGTARDNNLRTICDKPVSKRGEFDMAKRPFGVIPLDDELPSFPLPKSDLEREGLLKFWTLITEQLRHEDNLFDNRVQGFLISTSFLLAAFSQFREVKFIIVQA